MVWRQFPPKRLKTNDRSFSFFVIPIPMVQVTYSKRTNFAKASGDLRMPSTKYAAYKASKPYFDLVRKSLGDLVDGEHFFDVVADDIVYEVLYDLGWPRVIKGRAKLMDNFRGYGDSIE